jgi:TfoX/Sxy family transcriptional regulator of competence genes
MAYNERLAARIREVLAPSGALGERKMFGGICFMLGGHMVCGVVGEDLMLRVGPDVFPAAVSRPHARPMDFTGRPSTGMIYVAPAGCKTDKTLGTWLRLGMDFVRSLPARPLRKPGRAKPSSKPAFPSKSRRTR